MGSARAVIWLAAVDDHMSPGDLLRTCISAMVAAGLETGSCSLASTSSGVSAGLCRVTTARTTGAGYSRGRGRDSHYRRCRRSRSCCSGGNRGLVAGAGDPSGRLFGPCDGASVRRSRQIVSTALGRRIVIVRQVIETRPPRPSPPKNRRRPSTIFPTRTPAGVELTSLVVHRVREVAAGWAVVPGTPRSVGKALELPPGRVRPRGGATGCRARLGERSA